MSKVKKENVQKILCASFFYKKNAFGKQNPNSSILLTNFKTVLYKCAENQI